MGFIALDSESVTIEKDGKPYHKAVLLGASTGKALKNYDGLKTIDCLRWLVGLPKKRSDVFVWFVGHYDVNMIFRDLPDELKEKLYQAKEIQYKSFLIRYYHRKILKVSLIDRKKKILKSVTVYDTWGFFQSTFEYAVKKFLGETHEVLTWGKQARSGFTYDDFVSGRMEQYNLLECKLLVRLMDLLKSWFDKLDFKLKGWYGSSAISNYLMAKWEVEKQIWRYNKDETPSGLWEAFHCGYFGGRIEAIKLGYFQRVHNYDINSAYPSAISHLPVVTKRGWHWVREYEENEYMAVYQVEWNLPKAFPVGLLPFRSKSKTIYFPRSGCGWYWQPEVKFFVENFPQYIKIKQGFYHPTDKGAYSCNLYGLSELAKQTPELYYKRKKLKNDGDATEYCLKLALNSLYGKTCQKVGKAPYHCMPYAGYITSYTRAKLLDAIKDNMTDVIGFATDGILTTSKLDVPISGNLGEWSYDYYGEGHFLMSGVYRLKHPSDEEKNKNANRGYRALEFDRVMTEMNCAHRKYIEVADTKKCIKCGSSATTAHAASIQGKAFITDKLAMNQHGEYGDKALTFVNVEKEFNPHNLDKRVYDLRKIKNWFTDNCESKIIEGLGYNSLPSPERNEVDDDTIYSHPDYLWIDEV